MSYNFYQPTTIMEGAEFAKENGCEFHPFAQRKMEAV
jgi:hypothetical protein